MVPQNLSYFSFFGTDMNEGFVKSCPVFQRTHSLWMTSRARDEWQTYLLLYKTLHLTWSRSPSRSSTSWDVPHLYVSFAVVPSLVPCISGWDKVERAKIMTRYIMWCQESKVWYLLDEAQHKRREVGGACRWAIPNLRLKGWSQHKLITILYVYSYVNSNHNYAIVSCMWITYNCLYRGLTSSLLKFSTTVEVFLSTCFQSTE